jgi:hypothetical protein
MSLRNLFILRQEYVDFKAIEPTGGPEELQIGWAMTKRDIHLGIYY